MSNSRHTFQNTQGHTGAISSEGIPEKLSRAGCEWIGLDDAASRLRYTRIDKMFIFSEELDAPPAFPMSEKETRGYLALRVPWPTDQTARPSQIIRWMLRQMRMRYRRTMEVLQTAELCLPFIPEDELSQIVRRVRTNRLTYGELVACFDQTGTISRSAPQLRSLTWSPVDYQAFSYNWITIVSGSYEVSPVGYMTTRLDAFPHGDQQFAIMMCLNVKNYGADAAGLFELVMIQDLPIELGQWNLAIQNDTAQQMNFYALGFSIPTGIYTMQMDWTLDEPANLAFDLTIKYGLVTSGQSMPVVVTNTDPIWTTNVRPKPPSEVPRPSLTIQRQPPPATPPVKIDYRVTGSKTVHRAAYLVTVKGESHAPVFTFMTEVRNQKIFAQGGSKKHCLNSLRAQIENIVGVCDLQWTECVTVAEWEQARHNKDMHTLNGNTFAVHDKLVNVMFGPGSEVVEQEAETREERANRRQAARKQRDAVVSAVKYGVDNPRKKISLVELWDILDSYTGSEVVTVCDGMRACIYVIYSRYDLDQEFIDKLKTRLVLLNEVLNEEEIDDEKLEQKSFGELSRPPPVKKRTPNKPNKDADPFAPHKKKNTPPVEPEAVTKVPDLISAEMAKRAKRAVLQRIANKIPSGWMALGYLIESAHSKRWQRLIWAEVIAPAVIKEIGWSILNGVHPSVLLSGLMCTKATSMVPEGCEIDFLTLTKRIAEIEPDFMSVRDAEASKHNALMHALNGNIRACEAAKHNREMHALNGNTYLERKGLFELMTMAMQDAKEIDSAEILARISNAPGVNSQANVYYGASLEARFDGVTSGGALNLNRVLRLPVFLDCLFTAPVVGNPLGPMTFVDTIQAKGSVPLEMTPTGTLLYETAKKNNSMTARADNKSFNGFYAIDLVNMIQVSPLYDLNLETIVLKWLLCYTWAINDGLPGKQLEKLFDNTSDFALDPASYCTAGVNTGPALINSEDAGVVPPHSYLAFNGQRGHVYFHCTIQTVPQGAQYYYVPPALITGIDPFSTIAVLIMCLCEWPFASLFNTRTRDNGTVYTSVDMAGRVFISGETELHLILPTDGAERVPTTQIDANTRVKVDARFGNFTTASAPANAGININFYGGVLSGVELADFLVSWFHAPGFMIQPMMAFLTRLSQIMPVSTFLKSMYPLLTVLVTKSVASFAYDTSGAAPPAIPRNFLQNPDYMMRNRLPYIVNGTSFDPYGGPNVQTPSYIIHDLDPGSWNLVATGLYTQGLDTEIAFPYKIGRHFDFLAHIIPSALPYYLVGQLWTHQLGLGSADLINALVTPGSLPCYQNEVRSIFSSRQVIDLKLQPCPGSLFLEHIAANIVGFKPNSWNNGSTSLSIFDRYTFNGLPWVIATGAGGVPDGRWVPATLPDLWFELICVNVPLRLSLPPVIYNGIGATGFSLPNALELQDPAGQYVYPLMEDEYTHAYDKDDERRALGDKTFWNTKLRVVETFQNNNAEFELDTISKQTVIPDLDILPSVAFSPINVTQQAINYITSCIPSRSIFGYYLFAVGMNNNISQIARRYDLGTSYVNLSTIRYARNTSGANTYRQLDKPVKLLFAGTKSSKVQVPTKKDPEVGQSGEV